MTRPYNFLTFTLFITLLVGAPFISAQAQDIAPVAVTPSADAAPAEMSPVSTATAETPPETPAVTEKTDTPVADTPAPAPAAQTVLTQPVPATPLIITNEAEAIEAFAISQGINAVVEKVKTSDCPERIQATPAAALTCPCQFNDEIATLRTAYVTALAAHPEWKDRSLSFKEPVTKESVTLGMTAIRMQIESCGPRAL